MASLNAAAGRCIRAAKIDVPYYLLVGPGEGRLLRDFTHLTPLHLKNIALARHNLIQHRIDEESEEQP